MKKQITFVLIISALFMISCSNSSESDLIPDSNNSNNNNNNNTTITYTNTIQSVITANCITCHGSTPTNGAFVSLTTYSQVKSAVQNNGLIDLISRPQGSPGMMPDNGTRLPQATIDNFIIWRDNGFLE